MPHAQDLLAQRDGSFWVEPLDHAADHALNQCVDARAWHRPLGHTSAIAKHDVAIRDRKQILQPVADE